MRRMTVVEELDDGSYVVKHSDFRFESKLGNQLIKDTGVGDYTFPNIDVVMVHIYDKCSDGKRDLSEATPYFKGWPAEISNGED